MSLNVKTSFGNAPLSKNEMEALITNPMKAYVFATQDDTNFAWKPPTN